jgi:6-phosphogluconolactonase
MTTGAEMTLVWREFADGAALAEALADSVADHLRADLARAGRASLAVSGGRTPERFFTALSTRKLDWSAVTVTLVDERFVDETSERSNGALVRRALLQGEAAAARFVPLYREAAAPEQALPAIERALAALPLPFACVVLGMGHDGHTASFFPGGDRLAQALDPQATALVETMRAPGSGEPRLTLTAALLLQSKIMLHIEGAEKRAVLEQALQPGPVEILPVRAVLRQNRAPVAVFWCP